MVNNVILIESAGIGTAEPKLGGLLLANFLRLLGERDDRPEHIILLNEGVKIAQEGSSFIEHLSRLQDLGVKIIACRTCVEYFEIEDEIRAGEIGNMAQIQELLLTNGVVSV